MCSEKDTEKCDSCGEKLVEYYLPCNHKYCFVCLEKLFRTSLTDRSLLPPKCCRLEIDPYIGKKFFNDKEYEKFTQLILECSAVEKMYCPETTCSSFILLGDFQDLKLFNCPSCKVEICFNCRRQSHPSLTCLEKSEEISLSEKEENEMIEKIKEENKWATCRNCKRIIELKGGCYHITCVCKKEFCYLCGEKWKTCDHAHWDERNLEYEVENRIPENNLLERQNLRNQLMNEECVDHNWQRFEVSRRNKKKQCDNCVFFMNLYNFKCLVCRLTVCYVCRFHRLE